MLDTGCWILVGLPAALHLAQAGAERKSRPCGDTDYRLLDVGTIKSLYPVSILIIHFLPINREDDTINYILTVRDWSLNINYLRFICFLIFAFCYFFDNKYTNFKINTLKTVPNALAPAG